MGKSGHYRDMLTAAWLLSNLRCVAAVMMRMRVKDAFPFYNDLGKSSHSGSCDFKKTKYQIANT